jgi:hypothetical protein
VPAVARMVLLVGGTTMLFCGLAVAALGLVAGAWIRSQLPQVVIDASAVGGATFALGVVVAGAGGIQLVVASLRLASRWLLAGAAVLAALVSSLLLACSVAAATQVARGGTPWLLAPSLGLLVAAVAYGAGAWQFGRASTGGHRPPG